MQEPNGTLIYCNVKDCNVCDAVGFCCDYVLMWHDLLMNAVDQVPPVIIWFLIGT